MGGVDEAMERVNLLHGRNTYGTLTPDQVALLVPFIEGRVVHDLGCGTGYLSRFLVTFGAKRVIAIDQLQALSPARVRTPGIQYVKSYFVDYDKAIDTAFVSWPQTCGEFGLDALVRRARVVCYLGKNTDGTGCGSQQLWGVLMGREVLAHGPDSRNSLIVYGPKKATRARLPEEIGATTISHHLSYDETLKLARDASHKGNHEHLRRTGESSRDREPA